MNIGDKFIVVSKRKKDQKTIIILHDYNNNKRFLWYIEGSIRIGDNALLYSVYLGKATTAQIKEYSIKAKAVKVD